MRTSKNHLSPSQITLRIKGCYYFEDLMKILSASCKDFNSIHFSATFQCWAHLWKTAREQVKNKQLDLEIRNSYQQEMKLMYHHLNGKTFSWLTQGVLDRLKELRARQFASIANSLSHFPVSKERLNLLAEIAEYVIGLNSLHDFNAQDLS